MKKLLFGNSSVSSQELDELDDFTESFIPMLKKHYILLIMSAIIPFLGKYRKEVHNNVKNCLVGWTKNIENDLEDDIKL